MYSLNEIRNRRDKHLSSSSYKLRFKNVDAQAAYDVQTIDYSYDKLARVIGADYTPGTTLTYGYDLAGNLVNLNGAIRDYSDANQLTDDGTNAYTYDNNGNLWKTAGVETHTWDRANRLIAHGGSAYTYDGEGRRVSQTIGMNVTRYLLDIQPGLAQVIGDSNGSRYIHAPRGIHQIHDGSAWQYPLQDGLGSVRGLADSALTVSQSVNYSPYGVPDTSITGFAFTGEWRDGSGVQYHRARYVNPALGTFLSLDPFEGLAERAMSLNGYGWVEGNVVNAVDSSGKECNRVAEALRYATLDQYVRSTQFYTSNQITTSCPLKGNIVDTLVRDASHCWRTLRDIGSEPAAFQSYLEPLQLMLFDDALWTNYRFDRAGVESDLRGRCASSSQLYLHALCQGDVFRFELPQMRYEAIKSCFPIWNPCTGENLSVAPPPTYQVEPYECDLNDIFSFNVQSIGVYLSASFFIAVGGAFGALIITEKYTGTTWPGRRVLLFSVSEAGVGIGGEGASLVGVATEATLDQVAGQGFGLSGGALVTGSVSMSLDGLCNATVTLGGTIGAGISLTLSQTNLVLDSNDIIAIFQYLSITDPQLQSTVVDILT